MRQKPITFGYRLSCLWNNVWLGIRAPFDGGWRGAVFGARLAPKMGTLVDLLTCYAIPTLFGTVMGGIGFCAGCAALVGCMAEALRQLAAPQPYDMPISRILVDWIPATL